MTMMHRDTVGARYGMRRADGRPWRTEPRFDGDTSYYALGDEVTDDGMVFVCWDEVELFTCVDAQRDDADSPHPGDVIPVKAQYRKAADGWKYVYEDIPDEEYTRRVENLLTLAGMIARRNLEVTR